MCQGGLAIKSLKKMPGSLNVICDKYKNQIFPTLNEAKLEAKLSESQLSENMNESELKNNWFKTWHDNDYCKLDQTSESLPSDGENISNGQFNNHKSAVPLNQLLENIPLAYSPITKQLHVLTPKESNKISSNIGCQLFDKSDKNCDDNLNVPSHKPPTNHSGAKETTKISEQVTVQNDDEEFLCKAWNNQIGYCDETPKNEPSVSRTETSSFSSIVSSLSENSTFNNQEDNTSGKLSILDNDDLSVRSLCSQDSGSTCGENSKFFDDGTSKEGKRKGFTGFFSRNVFAWKPANSLSSQGWKIFGRHPGQDSSSQSEAESQVSVTNSPSNSKKYEDVIVSSSALILHKRPANLPAKSFDEQQKHILEYEQIVEAARKKEVKESKKRKKQLQQQLKFEEQLTNASKIWTCEVLPKWETMKNARKTRDLWWAGLPPSVRGKIWKLAIGNELNITYQLYEICSARAQERLKNVELNLEEIQTNDANKESSVELIQLDISRTFPQLCIFQKGGPYYDILHCLLGAYVCYRPDVGYVQGMSFIAAVLILNLEPADAFICFANLLNRPCHLAFFTLNQSLMNAYYDAYNGFFKENLPRLYQHFQDSCLTPDLYLLDWVYSVFAKAMHLDIACRVWDVFLRDGEEFLFRAALGILHLHQEKLLKLDFINGAQFLRKLPEDLSADLLFKSIDSIKMCVGKVKFSQVLAGHLDKHSDR